MVYEFLKHLAMLNVVLNLLIMFELINM